MKYYVELSTLNEVFILGKLYPVKNHYVVDEEGITALVMCFVNETGYLVKL